MPWCSLGVLIGLYVADWATSQPPTIAATIAPPSSGGKQLTLETVAAIGPKYSPTHPDWVSYLVRKNGKWVHSTIYTVPANSIVHVTIYQYDGDTGLRNPFLSQVQGTVGGTETIDGKTVSSINPEETSHTFVVPQLGVFVPLPGVPEEAKNQCEFAPCEPRSPPYDRIQLPHRREGPLPLAVLRARAPPASSTASAARCRRSATWTGSWMSSSPDAVSREAAPEPNHAVRFTVIWVVATVIALPLVIFVIGPLLGPGNGSVQSTGQGTDNTVLAAIATPVLLLVMLYLLYAVIFFRQPKGAALEGPAVRGRRARADDLDHRHLADRARGRRLRDGASSRPTTAPARAAARTR